MATLPTLLVNGNGTSPRNWTNQDYTNIDEGISSADGSTISHTPAKDETADTSFTLANMPTDFASMDTLSHQVRFSLGTVDDDTYYLDIRIMSGATELARGVVSGSWARVATVTATRSMANTASAAFSYVNTSATKTQWDAATVEIRIINVGNKAGDGATVAIDTLQFTGTYTQGGTSYDETGRTALVVANTASTDAAGFSEARAALALLSTTSTDTYTPGSQNYDETGRTALATFAGVESDAAAFNEAQGFATVLLATASTDAYTQPSNIIVDQQSGRLKPGRWNWNRAQLHESWGNILKNLVLAIPMWENTGAPTELISGTIADLGGTPEWGASPLGSALIQDANSDYVSFPNNPTFFERPTTEITVIVVGFRYTGTPDAWSNYVGKSQSGSPDKSWQFQQVADTAGKNSFSVQAGANDLRAQPTSALTAGKWYTLVGAYGKDPDNTVNRRMICREFDALTGEFIQEAYDGTTVTDAIQYDSTSTGQLMIGSYRDGSTQQAAVDVTAVYVFDRVLSFEEQRRIVRDPFGMLRAATLVPLSTAQAYNETGRSAAIVASTASTDAQGMTEAAAATTLFATANTDAVAITEAAAALVEVNTASSATVSITQSLAALALFAAVETDAVAITDSRSALVVLATASTDASAMLENTTALVLLDVTSTAGTLYTDSGAALASVNTAATDVQAMSEALSALVLADSAGTDQASYSENLAGLVVLSAQSNDAQSITESAAALTLFNTASTAGSFITENLTAAFILDATQAETASSFESRSAGVELNTASTDTYSGASHYDETGRTALVVLAGVGSDTASFTASAAALTLVNTTATDVVAMTEATAALVDLNTTSSVGVSITESGAGLTLFAAIESESQTHTASGAALANLTSLSSDVLAMEDLRAALTLFQTASTDIYTAGTINETGRSAQVIVATAQSDVLSATETASALVLFAAVMTDSTVEHLTATMTLGAVATVYFIPDVAPGPGSARSRTSSLPTARGGGIPGVSQARGIPGVGGGSAPSKATR